MRVCAVYAYVQVRVWASVIPSPLYGPQRYASTIYPTSSVTKGSQVQSSHRTHPIPMSNTYSLPYPPRHTVQTPTRAVEIRE
ncbi:hypothetical protein GGS23DRAFT_573651 [Durotheca rogersii]|uniref:uncharacterized protein n=1 Tax=Durotheca rogersii TaxID=419775 RepID=UPI00221F0A92|nr:uncharacterized protein GGS23DRAFT_573651 [Durotheca rogersii]KAI5861884.1 hypothetical protein GGS23DRAFT_573651 [Durotheca rogersii]